MPKKPFSKNKCKAPKPRKRGNGKFELRTIAEADSRYHVVKQMRLRIKQMMQDCAADTLQKEMLVGRAVFICQYLESQEVDSLEGQEMDWRTYLQAVRSLADVLNKLGLDKASRSAKTLESYLLDARKRKGKRLKVVS